MAQWKTKAQFSPWSNLWPQWVHGAYYRTCGRDYLQEHGWPQSSCTTEKSHPSTNDNFPQSCMGEVPLQLTFHSLCTLRSPETMRLCEIRAQSHTADWEVCVCGGVECLEPPSEGPVTLFSTSFYTWMLAVNGPTLKGLLQAATATGIKRMALTHSLTAFQAAHSNLELNPECGSRDTWSSGDGAICAMFQIFLGKDDYSKHLKVAPTEKGQDLVRTNAQ